VRKIMYSNAKTARASSVHQLLRDAHYLAAGSCRCGKQDTSMLLRAGTCSVEIQHLERWRIVFHVREVHAAGVEPLICA
jgi:hypothetical protein